MVKHRGHHLAALIALPVALVVLAPLALARTVKRWLRSRRGEAGGGDPGAYVTAPKMPRRPRRQGAAAVEEP